MERDVMDYDVVIVGAGPSGLSSAIKLAQLAKENNKELSICLIEKGSEIGAHILSGNVFEPTALNELIPDWKDKGAPLNNPAKKDVVKFMIMNLTTSFLAGLFKGAPLSFQSGISSFNAVGSKTLPESI